MTSMQPLQLGHCPNLPRWCAEATRVSAGPGWPWRLATLPGTPPVDRDLGRAGAGDVRPPSDHPGL